MEKLYNELLTSTIYQVFVRNHTKEGTFKALIKDLDRIQDLGVNIIYLLPINPIGEINRKGLLGSPYAISDYRTINPELGTMNDFIQLIDEIHRRDMKVMIDIVFHHTAYGSKLSKERPEWFVRKNDGNFGNKVGDWWDIIDLDFSSNELQEELIDVLLMYAKLKVDGFRCDVAPLIPLSFWKEATKQLKKVNPSFIMLSESVDPGFIVYLRGRGFDAHSDGEMYQAFDILYDYDVYNEFKNYLLSKGKLEDYLEKMRMQEYIYPANYLKIRFLENHDQVRIASLVENSRLINLTAFSLFAKGVGFIYAGQEMGITRPVDLFNKDDVIFENNNQELTNLIKKLIKLKRSGLYLQASSFTIVKLPRHKDLIVAYYNKGEQKLIGIFNLANTEQKIRLSDLLLNGTFENLIDNKIIKIVNKTITVENSPLIFQI